MKPVEASWGLPVANPTKEFSMKRLLTKLFGRHHGRGQGRRPGKNIVSRVRPRLEGLEERVVLDFGSGGGYVPPQIHRNVNIFGTPEGDHVEILMVNGKYAVRRHNTSETLGQLGVPPAGALQAPDELYNLADVDRFVFYGNGGHDSFINNTSATTTAYGGSGNDILIGGSGSDTFYGEAGTDTLEGRQGTDLLDGGADNDLYVYKGLTGRGADTIVEAANDDTDTLDFTQISKFVTAGNPDPGGLNLDLAMVTAQPVWTGLSITLSSNSGVEDVRGSEFNDVIKGNARNNWLMGGAGDDSLYGRAGSNTLSDGPGNDTVDFSLNAVGVFYFTYGGNDTVIGSPYADVITGSSGNDRLEGGGGHDQLSGGLGDDSLFGGSGNNTLSDGLGNDTVDFSQNAVGVTFSTGGGSDTAIGSPFADIITGSSGNDRLEGRGGDDQLFGGAGSDSLYGGNGNDRLFGDSETDALYGENDNDWLEAGSATETADGGAGYDFNAHVWAIKRSPWATTGATYNDIYQANIGTCVFLSALSGAAAAGIDLASRISYLGNYTYEVMLYNPGTEQAEYRQVTFDGTLQTYTLDLFGLPPQTGQIDPSPAPDQEGESWTLLFQRAYLQMTSALGEAISLLAVDFTDAQIAMYALTGRSVSIADGDYGDAGSVRAALQAGQVVIAGNHGGETSLIANDHAYTVLQVYSLGGYWWVTLRNPWGVDGGSGYGDTGDGIIGMSWADFVNTFEVLCIS
jgi:Ca2+-binding RTX toxin-like protein